MVISLILLLSIAQPNFSKAAEIVNYPNEVNVSVQLASTITMTLNGEYQLLNKDTSAVTTVPKGSILTIKKGTAGVNVTYTNFNQNSVAGFDVQESVSSSTSLTKLSNGKTYRGSFWLRSNGSQIQVSNVLDIEDYLKGVVPSEMPASWPKEALKAQAIAARSYAANSMKLSDTAASQVYGGYSAEDSRANTAIKETEGMTVKYNGNTIQTFFFSTSGGRTANVSDVWNSSQSTFPYLVSVDDPYENVVCLNNTSCSYPYSKSSFANWTETFTADQLLKSFGITDTTAKITDLVLGGIGQNGEVKSVTLKTTAGDKTISGNELNVRKAFPIQNDAVYNSLYSSWFTAKLNGSTGAVSVQTTSGTQQVADLTGQVVQTASGQVVLSDSNVSIQTASGVISNTATGITSVTLTGKGWGHRVGMSQYGARGFALMGYTAEQILTHYFKGTTVSK